MIPSSLRALVPATALLAAFAALSACHVDFDHGDSDRYQESFHASFPLNPGGRLNVDNENGSIDIATWERNEVEINATKYANSEDLLKDIRIETDAPNKDSVTIRTIRTTRTTLIQGNTGARYTIRVPKKVSLSRIHSTNGAITVDGTEGPANLESTNGSLHFNHMSGSIEGRTTNGSIELESCKGDTRLVSSNGRIEGELSAGAIDAQTTNGEIRIRASELSGKPPLRASTSNGEIELTLDQPHETRANTSNATITVHLPANANADIRARTTHSRVTSDFGGNQPADAEDGNDDNKHKSLDQRLGAGGPLLDLTTTNGTIHIARR